MTEFDDGKVNTLRITEIFFSIQGEAKTVGCPTVFVRLTGCPLRCQYCDSAYAFSGGEVMSLDDIIQRIEKYPTKYITITGGEPLAQEAGCLALMKILCDNNYQVSIETSGALDIFKIDPRVARVVDIKTPGSKEVSRNLWENIRYLKSSDAIKFVICDREDYDWSKKIIAEHQLTDTCEVFFSASYGQMNHTDLANWIVADGLKVRYQLQLHKYIWGDIPGV